MEKSPFSKHLMSKLAIQSNVFVELGKSKHGSKHVAFLRNKCLNGIDYNLGGGRELNSYASYQFLQIEDHIQGVVFEIPANIEVQPFGFSINGGGDQEWKPIYELESLLGIIMFESDDGSLLFSTNLKTPLLVDVDEKEDSDDD